MTNLIIGFQNFWNAPKNMSAVSTFLLSDSTK